jgi:branched-chain amino acid transport system ATP-binding protein
LLEICELSAGYGRTPVLHGVSLSVTAGETVALLGANGAGKTTLLKAIMGIVVTRSGKTMYRGETISRLRTHDIVRRGIALVPEGRHIFTQLSVQENLMLAAYRSQSEAAAQDLEFVLDTFPILRERRQSGGGQLSGGQQQMLALGRAVMQRPQLILLDEPSLGLSPLLVEGLVTLISKVRERTGASILIVEQDAGMALDIASRAYVLRDGQMVHTSSSAELRGTRVLLETYLGGKPTS